MPEDKFTWEPGDIEIYPSMDTERYVLSAAAIGAIEMNNSKDIDAIIDRGYITEKFELTSSGESRLKELLRLTEQQDTYRFILALASVGSLTETGPMVKKLISFGWINDDYTLTEAGQVELASLSGLQLLDKPE